MAKQYEKLNFEEMRFNPSASPAIDKETERRINRFRNRHFGAITLQAYNR